MSWPNSFKKNDPELKGFDRRGLYRMRQFFEAYENSTIVSAAGTQLQPSENQYAKIGSSVMTQLQRSDIRETILIKISWTHHLMLLSRSKTDKERLFYLELAMKEHYSVRDPYLQQRPVKELAERFGRTKGAIYSRLKLLELSGQQQKV